jgi:hypothetical protein
MPGLVFNGSNQSCIGNAISWDYPRMIVAWSKSTSFTSSNASIVESGIEASANQFNRLQTGGLNNFQAMSRTNSSSTVTGLPRIRISGIWMLSGALFLSASSRYILESDVFVSSAATSATLTETPNRFTIGSSSRNADYFSGSIAHVAVYQPTDLNDAISMMLRLYRYTPDKVEPSKLLNYWPDCTTDLEGGINLTPQGSPTVDTSDIPQLTNSLLSGGSAFQLVGGGGLVY